MAKNWPITEWHEETFNLAIDTLRETFEECGFRVVYDPTMRKIHLIAPGSGIQAAVTIADVTGSYFTGGETPADPVHIVLPRR